MTTRDAIKLAKRVEFWQKKLPLLGIAHFKVTSVSVVDPYEMPDGAHTLASVQVSDKYDTCRFWFSNEYADNADNADQADLDETIIHEWIHVAMRDFDVALEAVESWMPEATYRDFNHSVTLRREGLVDRVARQLYDALKE